MGSTHDFAVYVPVSAGSAEDWKAALHAPAEGLPALDQWEKDRAARTGASEEDFARGKMPGSLARERLETRGHALGEHVQRVLEELGEEYRLIAVVWEGFRLRWLFRIQSPRGVTEVPVPAEVADGVVDSHSVDDLGRLRNLTLFGAGRTDLLFGKTR